MILYYFLRVRDLSVYTLSAKQDAPPSNIFNSLTSQAAASQIDYILIDFTDALGSLVIHNSCFLRY